MDNELCTFQVQASDFRAFQKRFDSLCRKAKKLGVSEPTFTMVEAEKVIPAIVEKGEVIRNKKIVNVISVSGQAPMLNGWKFVAVLQHEAAGNIIHRVPGFEAIVLSSDLRTVASFCEHCKTNRKRTDTFVVVNTEGKSVQVGRNCLKDFCGGTSPESVARWAELLGSFEAAEKSESIGVGSSSDLISLETFLQYSAAAIRELGWVSRTTAREYNRTGSATADIAWTGWIKKNLHVAECDHEVASKVLNHVRAYFEQNDVNALSDYEHNLRLIVDGNVVDYRSSGLAASLIRFSERLRGQEMTKKARETEVNTPAPEGVVVVVGNVVSVKYHDNAYGGGFKMTVKVATDKGVWLCWGSVPSGLLDRDGDEAELKGKTVKFTATLKRGNDAHFALFSRPRKAEVLTETAQLPF